ncbi:unnamed protein product [Ostreobium quekettii]|uniref:Uncharacterized protein n=1 Tax=Ostreobium quekettii TaxID=121088 RepID=A0A8S1IQB9_9CHLO|nr:unnamed protein product [Ostreobium quekettii]|eukprot:evm.model.scf_135.2 EVM.evm.TU.scf_135.2   scf_135:18942-23545(-)
MALSMVRNETSKWEVVKPKRGADKKRKDGPQAAVQPAQAAARGAGNAGEKGPFSAFDALHADTDARRREGSNGSSPRSLPAPETPPRPEQAPQSMGKKKDKKKKQQAAKELPPKAQPAAPSPGLSVQNLKTILKDVAMAYPDNEAAQVQYVADKFLAAFKDKSLPFPAEIYLKPIDETVSMFDSLLSAKMTAELDKFLRSKSIDALVESLTAFCRALFDCASGPKAQLKGHAGLVVMIVAMARSVPLAVVRCCDVFVTEGARFAAPNKLPLLVWVFAQAERGASGSLLALWLQAILPQLLEADQGKGKKGKGKAGQQAHVLEPTSYTVVADCLRRGLNGGSGSGMSTQIKEAAKDGLSAKCGGTQVNEPVVSLRSLDQVQCAIHLQHARLPVQVVTQLQDVYPAMRSIALSCASQKSLHGFLKSSLEYAAKSEGGYLGRGDSIVEEAVENVITCLSRDPECFDVWTTKHRGQIRGSCRVLQHLLHAEPASFRNLLSSPANRDRFMKMVKKLQDRHGFLLAQGKGWQGACARGAHEACKSFLGKSKGGASKGLSSVSPKMLFVIAACIGLGAAFVATKWDDIVFATHEFLGTEQGKVVLEMWERVERAAREAAGSEQGQWVLGKVEVVAGLASEWFEQAKEVAFGLGNSQKAS